MSPDTHAVIRAQNALLVIGDVLQNILDLHVEQLAKGAKNFKGNPVAFAFGQPVRRSIGYVSLPHEVSRIETFFLQQFRHFYLDHKSRSMSR